MQMTGIWPPQTATQTINSLDASMGRGCLEEFRDALYLLVMYDVAMIVASPLGGLREFLGHLAPPTAHLQQILLIHLGIITAESFVTCADFA